MYLRHFGLEKNPFSLTPDPRFLFLTSKHREALAALFFAVTERKGFMVMTGDAGTGKTTLVRKLLLSIPETCAQFSVLVNPALTRSELLESVLMDFGQAEVPSSKAVRMALFKKILLRAQAQGRTSVLVVDEAHLLTGELIDEVRLLSNFETSDQKLLQIILVGQNELDNILNLDSLKHVKQRIAIRAHINPLAEAEVARYLKTRWSRACTQHLLPFSDAAIQLIARSCGGIPRVINVICDAALVNAYGTGSIAVGVSNINEALHDLEITASSLSVSARGAAPAFSKSGTQTVDRVVDQSSSPVSMWQHVEKKPTNARFWKLGQWFRTADGEAK